MGDMANATMVDGINNQSGIHNCPAVPLPEHRPIELTRGVT